MKSHMDNRIIENTEVFVTNLSNTISILRVDEAMKEKLSNNARCKYVKKRCPVMRRKYHKLLYTI